MKRTAFRIVPPRLNLWLYARDTDRRVARDPTRASGHPEAAMAPLVMAYTRGIGLEPHHRLLDFGCGTLRTGKHLIDYLERGRYVGVDISRSAVRNARGVVARSPNLAGKDPVLSRVRPFADLDLPWTPDFILCHSVFSHLPRSCAKGTFRQLSRIMGPRTTIVLTAFVADEYERPTYKNVRYPVAELVRLARGAGIQLERHGDDWGLRQTVFVGRCGQDDDGRTTSSRLRVGPNRRHRVGPDRRQGYESLG